MISAKATQYLLLILAAVTFVAAASGLAPMQLNAGADNNCVNGFPAANDTDGGYQINYASVKPTKSGQNYDVDPSWASEHAVVTMSLYMTHNSGNVMNQYAAFKCQFSCNANSKCVSFFGRYVDINESDEHFECNGYDELLEASHYVKANGTIPVGGYDALCSSSVPKAPGARYEVSNADSLPAGDKLVTSWTSGVAVDEKLTIDAGVVRAIHNNPTISWNPWDVNAPPNETCTVVLIYPSPSQNLTNYHPSMTFYNESFVFWLKNDMPANSTGLNRMFDGCMNACFQLEGCASVFLAWGAPDPADGDPDPTQLGPDWVDYRWQCTFFSANLTQEVYANATVPYTWQNPIGWNVWCNNDTSN